MIEVHGAEAPTVARENARAAALAGQVALRTSRDPPAGDIPNKKIDSTIDWILTVFATPQIEEPSGRSGTSKSAAPEKEAYYPQEHQS